MLHKLLLAGFIVCIFVSCGSDSSPADCGLYRKGRFNSHMRSEGPDYFFKFVRNDSIQLESDEKTGDKATYRIVWTSPCSYELYLLSTTRQIPDSVFQLVKKIPLKTTIVSGTNDYYLFESTTRGISHVLKDTLWLEHTSPEKLPAERPGH